MTPAEERQWFATVEVILHLWRRGVGCGADFPTDTAPVVRVNALSRLETTALADGHYEIWDAAEPPLAPVASYLSLDEALALLCAHEGRA